MNIDAEHLIENLNKAIKRTDTIPDGASDGLESFIQGKNNGLREALDIVETQIRIERAKEERDAD